MLEHFPLCRHCQTASYDGSADDPLCPWCKNHKYREEPDCSCPFCTRPNASGAITMTPGDREILMPESPFHIRLRQHREQAGLSVAELAAKADLQRTHLHALESGRKQPKWETVCRLADALGVSVEAFRKGDG